MIDLADGPLQYAADDAGVKHAESKWVEERGPRGGRRWKHTQSGKITYKDPMGATRRNRAQGGTKDGNKPKAWERLEELLNKDTMQDEPPRPGHGGKDPDDVGFGVPDLPKEPSKLGSPSEYADLDSYQRARLGYMVKLGAYMKHALPHLLPKMTRADLKKWAEEKGLHSAGLTTTNKKNAVERLVKEASSYADYAAAQLKEREKYRQSELDKIQKRTEQAMKKAPDVKIGDLEYRKDLVPDDVDEIRKESRSIGNMLAQAYFPFGKEVDAAIDDMANFEVKKLWDKYGAMAPVIAGAALVGGGIGGTAGLALGSVPLLGSLFAQTAAWHFLGGMDWTTASTFAGAVSFLTGQSSALGEVAVGTAGGGAEIGRDLAVMPFIGLARAIRNFTQPAKPYARELALSPMEIKDLAANFLEDYADGFDESLVEYLTDNPPGGGLAEPLEG